MDFSELTIAVTLITFISMKNRFGALIVVLFAGLFVISSQPVFAQSNEVDPNAGKVGFETHCLEATRCTQELMKSGVCVARDNASSMHRAKLENKTGGAKPDPINPNLNTYVTECFSYPSNCQGDAASCAKGVAKGTLISGCTTGNGELDMEAFCPEKDPTGADRAKCEQFNFYDVIKQPIDKGGLDYNLFFTSAYGIYDVATKKSIQPQMFQAGNLPVLEWTSHTPNSKLLKDGGKAHERRFLAWQPHTIVDTTTGESNAQQQQSLNFETEPAKCIPLSWDPAGRLFDAVTLEPIPDGSVMLYKQVNGTYQDASITEQGIANPYLLSYDGGFNFIVSDGIYKLTPKVTNYTFPASASTTISANYTKIYSELYPVETGEEILQQGKLQHRDVPMVPNSAAGYHFKLQVLSLFQDLNKISGSVVLQGRVSHPFTLIKVFSLIPDGNGGMTRGKLVFTGQADKMGVYNVSVSQEGLARDEIIGDVVFEKIDLTKDLTQQTVTLETSEPIRINPILNYIEGIAYSPAGDPIKNGKVEVRSSLVGARYATTNTDENGSFKLESRYLPSSPYVLRYITSAGVTNDTTTTKYIQQNTKLLNEKKIDPKSFVGPTPAGGKNSEFFTGEKVGVASASDTTSSTSPSSSLNALLLMVIVIVLLGASAGILYIYIQKRKNTPSINS